VAAPDLLARALHGISFPAPSVRQVVADLERIPHAPPGQRLLLFLLVLDQLARTKDFTQILHEDAGAFSAPRDHIVFAKVLSRIHANLRERVTLKRAAAHAGMSVATFTRFFRRMTGKSYLEYMIDCRLRRACSLLTETDRTILDISLEVGFRNLSNFNRRFRERLGVSPSAYRASHRNAK
jgi:AraC-like DNA-binding protein